MRYIEGFRNVDAAAHIGERLRLLGRKLEEKGRRVRIMEVCGTHTMAIARFGIRGMLPDNVEIVSGPGCPVCVTDPGYIDAAAKLAEQGVSLATFGDLMRVPGSTATLSQIRARGAEVNVCYSPADALAAALERPDREVVFLAVGFETTVAPMAALVDRAAREKVSNFSLLTAFKRIPPAMFALLDDPDIQVDAFVLPAHVSAIIGTELYRPVVDRYGGICVVAGFEPLDILYGLAEILDQAVSGEHRLTNHYSRVVKESGNRKALGLMNTCLEPTDGSWRGIGVIPESALKLRPAYAQFDAALRYGVTVEPGRVDPRCLCGEVLKGRVRPADCSLFGRRCTPDRAVGPCMVSSEGSCAAAYKYEGYEGHNGDERYEGHEAYEGHNGDERYDGHEGSS